MAAVLESSFLRQRLRQMELQTGEAAASGRRRRLGQCDCTSYSYLVLATMLFSVGTVITVLAAGETHDYVFYTLGHMWLVGPIFVCSGLMVAVKTVLYLRKKYLLQMLLRQRALWRELVLQARRHHQQQQYLARNASSLTLPPSYESIVVQVAPDELGAASLQAAEEAPPPTYEEAMILFGDETLFRVLVQEKDLQSPAPMEK
ncbi:uncharacterized protein LOC132198009 [Neocloeon triangulifer]|uniref:uncharacterized protein LOC132198009 n=1 Tax=Neocloeon triangulifer TaxID=2078957 RepID=UPI00286FA2CB|nr:uncharacterized protein LOC132198009 [Neocloeon triangulifer]